jgi:hypothetical protein
MANEKIKEQQLAGAFLDSNQPACITACFQPAKYHLPTASFIIKGKKPTGEGKY